MSEITRQQFMDFFRSEDFHNEMTPDDCAEIFVGIFHGSSDVTKEVIEELCNNYSVPLIVLPIESVYVLFGTDYVKSYGENNSVLDIDLEYGSGAFDKIDTSVDSVTDILEKCIGWLEYEFISKEEYEMLLELQSAINNKEPEAKIIDIRQSIYQKILDRKME